MGTGRDPRMREALRLARAGESEQARQILIDILRQNRDNFDAWVVMAQVAESHKEAITCMKQALRLRPADERAERYLEFLLQGKKAAKIPIGFSPWLWGGLGAVLIACLAITMFAMLSRPDPQTPSNGTGMMSGAQPVAHQSLDCAVLIKEALKVSDEGCDRVGADQVCYGHDTVQVQLAPGTNPPFEQPGNTVPINILEKFIASPLDLQKGDWGVGVFRLEANLPGTLPGQLVTMMVFGNTTVQNTSGDMHAFYFSSSLGGIRCDAVPFDGVLVNMADGAGIAFKANGADISLKGKSMLQATANDSLVISAISGTGMVSALGQQQVLSAGQRVAVPMGGSSGIDASGPPSPPQPIDNEEIMAGCTLTGEGCPSSDAVAEVATNTPLPLDASRPTNTQGPAAPGQQTNTPRPVSSATGTVASSIATDTPELDTTNTSQPTVVSTKKPVVVTVTTPPPTTPPPTTPPPTTPPPTTPPPTTPPPTTPPPTTPPPTTPPPTTPPVDACSTISLSWGSLINKRMTINIASGTATTLQTVQITWPSQNLALKKINDQNVNAPAPSTTVAVSIPVSSGSTALTFMFEEAAASTGYSITLTFAGGCVKTFGQ